VKCEPTTCPGEASMNDGAPNPLRGLVLRHCNHGAGERAVGLSQLIQNCEVIGVGDRYQVAWDMPLRPVGMVIAAARDHGRQLAGAVGDTQRLMTIGRRIGESFWISSSLSFTCR